MVQMLSQEQSPLFGKIPPEIRNEIFRLVLQEHEDPAKPYARQTYYTRPGNGGEKRVDTSLLRTCMKVYEETKVVPLRDMEAFFFLGHAGRVPPDYREHEEGDHWEPRRYAKLTEAQWAHVKHVRMCAQLFAVEPWNNLAKPFNVVHRTLAPSDITLCIRYSDWWWWEYEDKLRLALVKNSQTQLPNSVTKLAIELETSQKRSKELDDLTGKILRNPESMIFRRRDGKPLLLNTNVVPKAWTWQGPTTFGDGQEFLHHPDSDTMPYYVQTLIWTVVQSEA